MRCMWLLTLYVLHVLYVLFDAVCVLFYGICAVRAVCRCVRYCMCCLTLRVRYVVHVLLDTA